ncbi:MAG: amino acid adenylation domain-containing protein [Blastocatellia bacterium]
MSNRNIADLYPLSPMQQGMLFHSLQAPESGVYFEQTSCLIRGSFDPAAFQRAWDKVVARHTILRTGFVWEGVDEPLQVVYHEVTLPWQQQDWRGLSEAEQQARLSDYLAAERRAGFDLAEAPLMRMALMRVADEAWRFVWNHHHLLIDGWSLPLLMQEVFACYQAFSQGEAPVLPPAQPFRNYIAWLQQQDEAQAENFWRETLRGVTAPTPLVVDHQPDRNATATFPTECIHVSAEATQALQSLARQHQLTMNTIVQGAWALLLARYSGDDDIVFGATVSGRPAELPGAETAIGIFINTLPVRARVRAEDSALSLFRQIQHQQSQARQFEYSSLVQIQGWSEVPRSLPLFESIIVFENYPVDEAMKQQRSNPSIEEVHSHEQTNYPLSLVSGPGRELELIISYDSSRFEADTIKRMLGHLQTMLTSMAENPQQPVSQIPLLTAAEQQQLAEWNETTVPFPADRCAHQLFEEQAARIPENIAVSFAGQTLTYRELNERANRLAHHLQKRGVGPEMMIGLCVERSFEMIVGILGIMKAGAAYVPLDPHYPADRLAFMLEDSQARLVLTQSHLKSAIANLQSEIELLCLDSDWPQIAPESTANPISEVRPHNLAYAIFTSGSTGQPKGTLLEHRGLCNFALAFGRRFHLSAESRLLQFGSLSFDGSVAEVFLALLHGAALHLAHRETLISMPELAQMLRDEQITTAILPPSVLRLLPADKLPALQTVVSVGEACTPEIIERWSARHRFLNGYGPTETTCGAICHEFSGAEPLSRIPIGRPVDNTQVFILDASQQPVPIGVPGEICIGGTGVARGYLNRPELTAEKFIAWSVVSGQWSVVSDKDNGQRTTDNGQRLYRTGDLARYLPDGNIEFLGRLDHQVKIRGLRIELGEIEAALLRHPAVREAAVIAREDAPGDKRLVAYVAGDAEAGQLREHLRQSLPDFLIPAAFVALDEMPLSPNGKVDRKRLPAPDAAALPTTGHYVAPRNQIEELLCEIYAAVLSLERVGIHDNFFDLGGHSLLATQLISRVREAFEIELPLQALFADPDVAGLAAQVTAALQAGQGVAAPPLTATARDGKLPLSFAQQRLWFLDQLEPNSPFYNNPSAFRLKGTLDTAALEHSLNEVIRRHEALRTTFKLEGSEPVQDIAPELTLTIPHHDLRHLDETEREAEAMRLAQEEAMQPFDLAQGPLLRAALIRLAEDDYVLLLTMHHIISDGWSVGVFIREIVTLYTAALSGAEAKLSALPIQYADYAKWQREWLQGETLQRQLDYWTEKLHGRPTVLELPTDRPRPAIVTSRGATISFNLPKSLQDALISLSRQEGVTLFMTLLAAFQTLLHRYSNQREISVGTPIASRTRAETENLIGFFVNTLVMNTDLSGDPEFTELLARVRETALGAYAHQDLPFEQLVEALQPERDLSHTPLFQVMLVLGNMPMESAELPGVTLLPFAADSHTARFDLTLLMNESQDGLSGNIEYNTDLFDASTIERLISHFRTLLEAVADDPAQPISQLPLLTVTEARQMLTDWNHTDAPYPSESCFHHLFEQHALARPDAVAVQFGPQHLTYAELNARASQLAQYLQILGVTPDTIVGICTERSLEMIVGILGVLKAGGAYLPLDPHYPADRLAFMFADSQARILLTQQQLKPLIANLKSQISDLQSELHLLSLDAEWAAISEQSAANVSSAATAQNLAYVIYTSGSTGQPKGTLLEHRGLCNLVAAQQQAFGVSEGKRVLQFSPFSFDASVWELAMALGSGATLVLARQEELISVPDLHRLLQQQRITHVTLPPSVLALLAADDLPELEVVNAAGERCTADIAARWSRQRKFFNAYGPTETTVCASLHLCRTDEASDPPIGRPLPNFKLFVLDEQQRPVPIGIPGELHIAGAGVARGYLHRPELTAEKFIAWKSEVGSRKSEAERQMADGSETATSLTTDYRLPTTDYRLYRTGDLVRWRADGQLEYLGRIDEQVKIRGFRIELGEIEAVLRQHAAVRDAVVAVREDATGDKRLVAYLITERDAAFNAPDIKEHLRQKLPEYMVPSHYLTLDQFPLSPSGKVDRKKLPAPDGAQSGHDRPYIEPRTETEKRMAGIWCELLGLERVGLEDNFFELGGHSLLATRLVVRLREVMQLDLPLRTLFEFPTLAAFAEAADRAGRAAQAPAIVPLSRQARRTSRASLQIPQHPISPENTGDQQAGLSS